MEAQYIGENLNFERGQDPKKSMRIGEKRYVVPPSEIECNLVINVNNDINISYKAGEYTKGRIFINFKNHWNNEVTLWEKIAPKMVEFLNSPEMKLEFAEGFQEMYNDLEESNPKGFKKIKNKK